MVCENMKEEEVKSVWRRVATHHNGHQPNLTPHPRRRGLAGHLSNRQLWSRPEAKAYQTQAKIMHAMQGRLPRAL